MTLLFPWIFLAILMALTAGIFLLSPRLSRRPRKNRLQKLPAPVFREEYSLELQPVVPDKALLDAPPPPPGLPHSYGIDRLVLMARDPFWLYAYWEITATKQGEFNRSYGPAAWASTKNILRVYDVTGIDFNGGNAISFIDIPVSEEVDNWHIHVGEPDRSFCVDIGKVFPDGKFIPLLRSNVVTTPRASLSDSIDEEWMWIEGLYRSIGTFRFGTSSPMIIQELAERAGAGLLPLNISSPGKWEW
ncbi:MAG: DUF4912 domain-containing protein [Eubacteriales bacterium]